MRMGTRRSDPVAVAGLREAAKRASEVAARVVGAATTDEAWDALETERERSAQEIADKLRALWVRVETGQRLLAEGKPVTPAVVARFEELHAQRLELLWRQADVVFRWPDERRRMAYHAQVADEEISKALGPNWPGEEVQEGMRAVNGATDVDELKRLCLAVLVAAVRQRYGGAA